MARKRIHVERPYRPRSDPILEGFKRTYHEAGAPAPWERARRDGMDVTTLPVGEWREADQARYVQGWRPDRLGDDPATIPENEREERDQPQS